MMLGLTQRLWIIAGGIFIAGAVLLLRENALLPDGRSHVRFLDVGQGDSILITSPGGRRILVDGGPDLSALEQIGKYVPFFTRSLDLVVLTHPDDDHVTALPDIVERYDVGAILLSGVPHSSGRYDALLSRVREHSVPVLQASPGQRIIVDEGLAIDILWPRPGHFLPELNDTSVVLRVSTSSGALLLPGDLSVTGEAALLASGQNVEATILKIGHHGSKTSTSTGFLLAVHPSLAVISVGRGNTFGHPTPETLQRLTADHISVRTTMEEGTVEVRL